MAKVLITGANGFLGSWLAKHLREKNHEVFALVRPNSDLSELEGINVQFVYGDITQLSTVHKACEGMDSIFHLAGLISYKSADRDKMNLVNITGTQNVIESCVQAGVRRLVHMSSVTAIGAGLDSTQVLNEDSRYNISHLNLGYFETKRQAEELVRTAVKSGSIDAVILNPSTIYGPGDAKKGSRKTQIKVARGEFPFYTSGGVNIVSVRDVVQGIHSAWRNGRTGERYILSGENLLIKDAFALIAQAAGQRPPSIELPEFALHALGIFSDLKAELGFRSSMSRETAYTSTLFHWFDSSKARRELEFDPKPARFAISESVAWMRENGLLKG